MIVILQISGYIILFQWLIFYQMLHSAQLTASLLNILNYKYGFYTARQTLILKILSMIAMIYLDEVDYVPENSLSDLENVFKINKVSRSTASALDVVAATDV